MATFFTLNALDAEINYIKTEATRVLLVDPYDRSDNYATVNSNTKGFADITTSDWDANPSTVNTNDRRLNFLGKQGAATADNLTPTNPHLVLVDVAATEVLAATDETSDKPVSNLDIIDFPGFYIEARQPDQVP